MHIKFGLLHTIMLMQEMRTITNTRDFAGLFRDATRQVGMEFPINLVGCFQLAEGSIKLVHTGIVEKITPASLVARVIKRKRDVLHEFKKYQSKVETVLTKRLNNFKGQWWRIR